MRNRKSRMFRYRSNGRNFRRQSNDGEGKRLISGAFFDGRIKNNFKQHQSVEKLLERYKILAKEALSSGDKILSENYLQHVDHFERMVSNKTFNKNENNPQVASIIKKENNNLPDNKEIDQGQINKNKE